MKYVTVTHRDVSLVVLDYVLIAWRGSLRSWLLRGREVPQLQGVERGTCTCMRGTLKGGNH